jgi:hypothetical protein
MHLEIHISMRIQKMSKQTVERSVSLCPFLTMGFDGCYHMQPDSRKVYSAIAYCQNNYLDCDIYKELKDNDLINSQKARRQQNE